MLKLILITVSILINYFIVSAQLVNADSIILGNKNDFNEVVITGTMKEVSRGNSPIPVDIYSPKLFQKNPTSNIFEALQMVNGIQPQINCNVCGTGDIHINGMEGAYTMITIDGMPIVSSLSTVYGLMGIPNSLIQRVEVVKGASSTLYGSEAMAGVINIITKNAASSPVFSADVFSTNQGEMNVDLGTKISFKKISSIIGGNFYFFNNRLDINNDNFTDVPLAQRYSIFNKWSVKRINNKQTTLALRWFHENRWGGEMQWDESFRGGDSIYGESIYTNRIEVIGNYDLPVKENIKLQYSYNYHHQNSVYGNISYIATQQIAFAQLLWNKKIGERNDLLLGLPIRYQFYDDNTLTTSGNEIPTPINKPDKIFLPGIFIQDEILIHEKFTTLIGFRYDYNNRHGNIITPRISFKYKINQQNTLRLSGGNGFRVVNLFTEDHAALTGSRIVEIRENLKPERSWNANLNYQKFITLNKGFISADANIFYTYFTNKIIGDFLTDANKIIYDNIDGYAVSQGFNINADVQMQNGFKAIFGLTVADVFQKEKDINGDLQKLPQIHNSLFTANYSLSYTINKAKLTLDFNGRINSPMHLPVLENDFRPDKSPWFSTLNFQLTKAFNNGIEIYGGVKNILNFIPKNPIMRPFDPFDKQVDDVQSNPNNYTFDASYNYAPIQGIRGFLGIRYQLSKK